MIIARMKNMMVLIVSIAMITRTTKEKRRKGTNNRVVSLELLWKVYRRGMNHRTPHKGDNGIRFEPIKDKRDS